MIDDVIIDRPIAGSRRRIIIGASNHHGTWMVRCINDDPMTRSPMIIAILTSSIIDLQIQII